MQTVVTQDKTELYVKDWGVGRPVILMHGWPLSSDSWDDQAMAIANAGYRVIAYDRRGFGRSSQPWDGYDYDTLSDDLAAVMAHTGAQDATLVGFSMGGGEVARYMSRHEGKLVSQAILISSILPFRMKTADNPKGTQAEAFAETARALMEDRPEFLARFFRDFFGVGLLSQPVSDELLEWARSVAMQASLRATLECLKSFSSTDFRPELESFRVPTLFIHGTDDLTVPIEVSSRPAAQAITQAKLLAYDDAPHGLWATHKARLSDDIINFLNTFQVRTPI
ncbi:MAG: alpha/beta hydrolase [Burkholderiales bacterium PBB3]|nr:MAG: alpha/beta hydrolase [Burkholderiales bacterium PBB3]